MNKKKLLVIAFVAILAGLFFYLDLGKYLTLASLKDNRAALAAFYGQHRVAMISLFIAVYIIQTALSLPGAAVLSLAGGGRIRSRHGRPLRQYRRDS